MACHPTRSRVVDSGGVVLFKIMGWVFLSHLVGVAFCELVAVLSVFGVAVVELVGEWETQCDKFSLYDWQLFSESVIVFLLWDPNVLYSWCCPSHPFPLSLCGALQSVTNSTWWSFSWAVSGKRHVIVWSPAWSVPITQEFFLLLYLATLSF